MTSDLRTYVIVKCLTCLKDPRRPLHYRKGSEEYFASIPDDDPCPEVEIMKRLPPMTGEESNQAMDDFLRNLLGQGAG